MLKVQIEENGLKIEDEDMSALVSIFAEYGIDAEPIRQETWQKGRVVGALGARCGAEY